MLPTREAEELLSITHSCGNPSWFPGFKQSDHCGVCYGCLVRRGALEAATLTDRTKYIEVELRGDSRRSDFLTATRRKTIEAVRYRLGRGYSERDILSMTLPPRLALDDALTIVRAGIAELAPIVNNIP